SLIGPPYNYWGDDDGDSGVTATGRLTLSIVDKNNQPVSRDTMLTTCTDSAPYRVTLSSTNGTLSTRYGVPNRSTFSASNVTYYVNPKPGPSVCVRFARPNLDYGTGNLAGPSSMWDPAKGFLTQETDPSRYGRNFPTTGANGLYFDLLITGSNQPLSWSSVSQGGITVTMSNSTAASVRVTLTGPYATTSQQSSDNPSPISTPFLPQTFELVGRDNNGNPVVKYGFTLKQWFVNRDSERKTYSNALSWCNSIGYQIPRVRDLTNASCHGYPSGTYCQDSVGGTPSSPINWYMRHIGSGFSSEWGVMSDYSGIDFNNLNLVWTSENNYYGKFVVDTRYGHVEMSGTSHSLCVYP
ncbi:hypothetical protein J3T94_03155, partial [Gilliamella sp. B3372]